MRFILLLLALFFSARLAPGQIIAVTFKDDDTIKEMSKHMVPMLGTLVLMGESKQGISYDFETGGFTYSPGTNELFVINPKKPESFPYHLDNGVPVESNKKHVLSFSGSAIDGIILVDRDQTLPGLTAEYIAAEERLDALRKARTGLKKDSTEWQVAQHQLITALETQEKWLENFGYTNPLKSVQKDLKKERKAGEGIPQALSYTDVLETIRVVETPEGLARISKEEFDGKHEFGTVESAHFRIHYLTKGNGYKKQVVSEADALRMIELAERALEGFRAEFVSPYLGDDYQDTIPEGLLVTWFFGPEQNKSYLRYANELFGFERKAGQEEVEVTGESTFGGEPERQRYIWRLVNLDLDGIICHQLGHVLSMFHYGGDEKLIFQDWLEEATANSLATRYLGRCGALCLGMQGKSKYLGREKVDSGKKVRALGRRSAYDLIAISQAGPIQSIALKRLYDMGDADLAKGWSFYEYVIASEGKAGQQYLRAAAQFSRDPASLVQKWREAAALIYGVDEREALSGVEARWRAYVEERQAADK